MNKTVSSCIKIFFWYFGVFVLLSILAAGMYMVYTLCQTMVAGQMSAFSVEYFVQGFFLTSPIILEFTSIFIVFYIIRHPTGRIAGPIVYIVCVLVSWYVLCPLLLNNRAKYFANNELEVNRINISSGFFRTEGDKVLYFSKVGDDNVADGVIIDLGSDSNELYTFKNEVLSETNNGFQDSLIKSTMEIPNSLGFFIGSIANLYISQLGIISHGYIAWLSVATMGLALMSLIGFRNFLSWRFLNVLLVAGFAFGIFCFNVFVYSPSFVLASVVQKFNGLFKGVSFIYNPAACLVNLIVFIAFTVLGIIYDGKRMKKEEVKP